MQSEETRAGSSAPGTWCGRTLSEPSAATKGPTLEPSSKKRRRSRIRPPLYLNLQRASGPQADASWEMDGRSLTEFSTLSFGESPSVDVESRLSQILEEGPHPKGSVVLECGEMLKKHGYRLKVLNTINFKKSLHYNPFHYIHSEKDVLKFVTALIANTTPKGSHSNDPFWEKAETLLLTALTAYIHSELREEEQNFISLLDLLNAMKVTEAGGGGPAGMPSMEEISLLADRIQENRGEGRLAEKLPEPEEPLAAGLDPVDLLFQELEEKDPGHFAVRQYKKYKQAAGKTAQSILISCGARLAPFDIREVRELTAFDELELDTLGDKIVYTESGERKDWKEGDPYLKTALFLIMSDTDSTFNFLISLCYTQLFNLLCEKADDVYGGRLPVHVRCLIDECANIGQIPNLEKLMATIRSREISAALVFQTQSQLKSIYKDDADTIIGNCDSSLPGPLAAEPYAVQAYLSALNGELEKVLKLSLPGGDWRMKKIGTLAAGMARANTLVRRELALEMAKGAGEGERDELILLAGNLTALLRRLKE